MNVDVHVHAIAEEHLSALASTPGARLDSGVLEIDGLAISLSPAFTSARALLSGLDARGIDVAVLSAVPPTLGYHRPPAAALRLAEAANRGLAALAAETGRCGWFATVPLQDPPAAAEVLAAAVERGAAGALIGTNVAGADLDAPALRPFFAAASRLGVPLLVHAVDTLAADRLGRHYFANLVGNPYEAGLAVGSVIFGGLLDEFPELRLIFCHGGGAAPALAGRWDHAWKTRGGGLESPPSSYFARLWFDTLTYSAEALRLLTSLAGPHRLLLGSDAPFPLAEPDPSGRLDRLDWLSPQDRDRIRAGNAADLFGL